MKEKTDVKCPKCNNNPEAIQYMRKEFWGNEDGKTTWHYSCDRCGFNEYRNEPKQ